MDDNADLTAHRLLREIYQNEEVALPVRMRAAIESLPYETPKLQAIAHINGNFADLLDKAIERRKQEAYRSSASAGADRTTTCAGGVEEAYDQAAKVLSGKRVTIIRPPKLIELKTEARRFGR